MGEVLEARTVSKEIEIDEGLRLRLLEPDDSDQIFEILKESPEIKMFITWTAGLESADDIRRKIEEFQNNDEVRYGIIADDEFVGYVAASPSKATNDHTEIDMGYFCTRKQHGKGYVTKAIKSLMGEVADVFPVETFVLYIEDRNRASQFVAESLGFHSTRQMAYDEKLICFERRYEKPAAELE